MKSLLVVALFFAVTCAQADPLLLRGVIENGALVLKQADADFINFVEEALQNADITGLESNFRKIVDGITASVTNVAGQSPVGMLVTPVHKTLVLNPISLSEGIVQDLAETGQSTLKIALNPAREDVTVPSTNISHFMDTFSGVALPVESAGLRGAIKHQIESIPEESVSLLNHIRQAITNPLAVLETQADRGSLRETISKVVPIEFGPLFSVTLTN